MYITELSGNKNILYSERYVICKILNVGDMLFFKNHPSIEMGILVEKVLDKEIDNFDMALSNCILLYTESRKIEVFNTGVLRYLDFHFSI